MTVQGCNVGFIGIGVMGKHMAEHIRKAGATMHIFTRTKKSAEELLEKGAIWYDTPATLAPHCDIIFTIVGYPHDVESIYFGPTGILTHAKEHTILVDMTTSSPAIARKIYEEAKKLNKHALDAPVSGGNTGAEKGTLSIMVGGDPEVFNKALPFFELMGKTCLLQGKEGCGQSTKAANQIAIAANLMGTVEAIRFAEKAGLNPTTMIETIAGGAAGSWQLVNNGGRIIKKDYSPVFFVKHFLKDLNIALDTAKDMNLELPLLTLAQKFYTQMSEQGYDDKGTQVLYDFYTKNGYKGYT